LSSTQPAEPVRVEPATAERWPDVVTVMGTRGDPSWCWCQFYRLRGQAWRSSTAQSNKAALCDLVVSSPVPPGVVAYRGDLPVGWCAISPKRDYARLVASRTSGGEVDGVWSVTCFVVRVGHRRQGVARALLAGAIELARAHSAAAIEAYPVDTSKRRSVSTSELFHGSLSLFVSAGFDEISRPSPARALVRLAL
jgi:GNAT superfamily N-acetyltransferase